MNTKKIIFTFIFQPLLVISLIVNYFATTGIDTYAQIENCSSTPTSELCTHQDSLYAQATTPPDSGDGAPNSTIGTGNLPLNYDFINIIGFRCLFSGQGCSPNESLIDALIQFLYNLATPLAILVIMYGGYQYFMGGFSGKVEGMKTIQAAVAGLVIVLTARLITSTVNLTFSGTNNGTINTEAITALITQITTVLVGLSLAIAVLVIIWGGYKYFFGSILEKSDGLNTIRAGITGLVFILLAQFIANTLNELFKDINEADQASELPGRIESVLVPIISQVTTVLQGLAGLVSVLVIVWGGYQYFFSTLPNGKKNGLETINKGVIGLVVTILALPIVTLVQQTIGASNETLELTPDSIIFVIQTIVTNFLIPISAAITVFFVILGAYQWLSAGGEASKVKSAKDSIKNAVIGLIVVLIATTFTQLIIFFFRNTNLNSPTSTTPTTSQTLNSTTSSTTSSTRQSSTTGTTSPTTSTTSNSTTTSTSTTSTPTTNSTTGNTRPTP